MVDTSLQLCSDSLVELPNHTSPLCNEQMYCCFFRYQMKALLTLVRPVASNLRSDIAATRDSGSCCSPSSTDRIALHGLRDPQDRLPAGRRMYA